MYSCTCTDSKCFCWLLELLFVCSWFVSSCWLLLLLVLVAVLSQVLVHEVCLLAMVIPLGEAASGSVFNDGDWTNCAASIPSKGKTSRFAGDKVCFLILPEEIHINNPPISGGHHPLSDFNWGWFLNSAGSTIAAGSDQQEWSTHWSILEGLFSYGNCRITSESVT